MPMSSNSASAATRHSAILAQANSVLGLFSLTMFIERLPVLTIPSMLAPLRRGADRYTFASRCWCQSNDCGYIVRGLSTARYLAAVPPSILLMGQQVLS